MNYCLMLCDNVRRDHKGPCKVCKCPDVLSPVCANDGQTYVNSCEANCKEVLVLHEGRCRNRNNDNPQQHQCTCPNFYDPVCAQNGETYQNYCQAECDGAVIARKGKCRGESITCHCSNFVNPVCGIDGRRYDSPCFAKCRGIPVSPQIECLTIPIRHSHGPEYE